MKRAQDKPVALPGEHASGAPGAADHHRQFTRLWGLPSTAGFVQVPNALLKNQGRLNLSPLDMLIILNIAMHWWSNTNLPFPTIATLAKRIGVTRRSVERRIAKLETSGVLGRQSYELDRNGKKIRRFDLSQLVRAVSYYGELEPPREKKSADFKPVVFAREEREELGPRSA